MWDPLISNNLQWMFCAWNYYLKLFWYKIGRSGIIRYTIYNKKNIYIYSINLLFLSLFVVMAIF